ncbi:hypothetical protein [Teichococcus aestuarii]
MKRLRMEGVQLSMLGGRIRACTHLGVTAPMIEETLSLTRKALAA